MKAVYKLVKEHVRVVEESQPPIDSDANPLIDPRSVSTAFLSFGAQVYIPSRAISQVLAQTQA